MIARGYCIHAKMEIIGYVDIVSGLRVGSRISVLALVILLSSESCYGKILHYTLFFFAPWEARSLLSDSDRNITLRLVLCHEISI